MTGLSNNPPRKMDMDTSLGKSKILWPVLFSLPPTAGVTFKTEGHKKSKFLSLDVTDERASGLSGSGCIRAGLKLRALVMALLAAVLFGAATPASKILLASASPFQIAGLLGLGSALVALPIVLRSQRGIVFFWRLDRKNRLRLALSLGFGGTLGPVLLLLGLRLANAGSVSMWLNLELVLTVIIAAAFFQEYVGRRGWCAVAIAFAAACLLTIGEGLSGIQAGILVALGCLCWAIDNNATATIDGITPAQTVFWKGLVSGVVNSALGLVIAGGTLPSFGALGAGLLIGSISFGTSIMLYIYAAQRLGATRTQTIFASAPFWGLVLSALLLGDRMTFLQVIAAVMLAGATALLFSLKHSHEHAHDDGVVHAHEHYPDLEHRHPHGKPGSAKID